MAPAAKTPVRPGPRSKAAVLVRLTDDEHRRLKEGAKRAGLGVGPWLRSLGLRETHR